MKLLTLGNTRPLEIRPVLVTAAIVLGLLVISRTRVLAQEQEGSEATIAPHSESQEEADATMQTLREAVRANKRAFVARNMELAGVQAEEFWPLYEAFQRRMDEIQAQLSSLVRDYAKEYEHGALTDKVAEPMIERLLSIERARVQLRDSYLPKFLKVLPATKVGRYYQIENKIWAVQQYELAGYIPLAR